MSEPVKAERGRQTPYDGEGLTCGTCPAWTSGQCRKHPPAAGFIMGPPKLAVPMSTPTINPMILADYPPVPATHPACWEHPVLMARFHQIVLAMQGEMMRQAQALATETAGHG